MSLINGFNGALYEMGIGALEHPVFYHAPVGIRFEIGGEADVYVKKGIRRKLHPNPKYVNQACERACTIFKALTQNDWLLRVEVYNERDIEKVSKQLELGKPQETVKKEYAVEEDEMTHYELYWDMNIVDWSIEKIVKEVILADIGGLNCLASAVFLIHPKEHILYHLYDDRGLDVIAKDKETLRPIYGVYKDWILEYDREEIDSLFIREHANFDLQALLSLLNQLEERKIYYKLNKVRTEAIMIEIAVPGQRWEVEILEDGSVDIEKFISEPNMYSANELEVLFEQFSD